MRRPSTARCRQVPIVVVAAQLAVALGVKDVSLTEEAHKAVDKAFLSA